MFQNDNIFFKTRDFSDTCDEYPETQDKTTKKWPQEPPQRYTGEIFNGNIHRHGFYFVENAEKLFYDGLFYSNKLEGYSQVFYNDGSNFQGLFRKNSRFGPGIYSYPNGEQDVGLWNGQYLTRLNSLNDKIVVPRLATTHRGQIKLLKYRYLVPVHPKTEDIAYTILKQLGASKKILKQSYKLYNMEVQNSQSIFFDKDVFDNQYYSNRDCYIDIALDDDSNDVSSDNASQQTQEEFPLDGYDVNAERIEAIKEELKEIEDRLNIVRKKKIIIEQRVQHCMECCHRRGEDSKSSTSSHEELQHPQSFPEVNFDEKKPKSPKKAKARKSKYLSKLNPTPPEPADIDETPEKPPGPTFVFPTETGKSQACLPTTNGSLGTVGSDSYDSHPPDEEKYPMIPLTSIITRYPELMQATAPGCAYVTSTTSADNKLVLTPDDSQVSTSELSNFESFSEIEIAEEEIREEESEKYEDIQIEQYLHETCICDEEMQQGELGDLESQFEAVTKDELFYECISKNLRMKLETHLEKLERDTKTKTKKMVVKEVLAWNNEEKFMRMLKHTFLHRKSEYMVNFKVSDLVSGNRSELGTPGSHERNCIEFLHACSTGDISAIFEHVNRNYVDVDVCDNKGNNGVMFAAVYHQIEAITVLTNLGAKLDQGNDEGLLPLSMCFLLFLAGKHDVEDWEKAFLPDNEQLAEQADAIKWYPNMSLQNMLARAEKSKESVKSKSKKGGSRTYSVTKEKKAYIFDTSYFIPTAENLMNLEDGNVMVKRTKSVTISEKQSPLETIRVLLDCGANPNTGDAPLPALIMSLFTGDPNLVEYILAAKADVNLTIKDDMTALHIAASLKCSQANVEICNLLLGFDADPQQKTSTNHWSEQKGHIIGDIENLNAVKDNGKNALHILCMRRDYPLDKCSYFQQMAMVLTDSNLDINETYLGHTPLSLAVLVGNQALVDTFLKLRLIDPHQLLGNGMGNVLTLYILKRYKDLLPPKAEDMLRLLVDLGVNPLRHIGEHENCIAFIEHEHEIILEGKSTKKSKSTERLKMAAKTDTEEKSPQEQLFALMKELCRNTIIQAIQLQAVENLYNLTEENFTDHECVPILTEFLTPFIIISNLQHLFCYGKIKQDRYDKDICLQLINMSIARLEEMSKKVSKKKDKKIEPVEQKKVTITTSDYGYILDMTDFNRREKTKSAFKLFPPGLDNTAKYKICFHCLKKSNNLLLVCPRCQFIYFCSESCNKANLKLKTLHTCNINFYSSELAQLKSETVGEEEKEPEVERQDFGELYERIRESCSKRRILKLEEQRELRKQQLVREMKADIYGTKRLRMMRDKRVVRTPTMTTLVGSVDYPIVTTGKSTHRSQHIGKSTEHLEHNSVLLNEKDSTFIKNQEGGKKGMKNTLSEEKYRCMLSKKHESSLKELAGAKISKGADQQICRKNICDCISEECTEDDGKLENKLKCFRVSKEKKVMETVNVQERTQTDTADNNAKKLRKIPERYQRFMELLASYFPDIDFSALLLPYACFSEGHLYYKFLDSDFYTRTYSMM